MADVTNYALRLSTAEHVELSALVGNVSEQADEDWALTMDMQLSSNTGTVQRLLHNSTDVNTPRESLLFRRSDGLLRLTPDTGNEHQVAAINASADIVLVIEKKPNDDNLYFSLIDGETTTSYQDVGSALSFSFDRININTENNSRGELTLKNLMFVDNKTPANSWYMDNSYTNGEGLHIYNHLGEIAGTLVGYTDNDNSQWTAFTQDDALYKPAGDGDTGGDDTGGDDTGGDDTGGENPTPNNSPILFTPNPNPVTLSNEQIAALPLVTEFTPSYSGSFVVNNEGFGQGNFCIDEDNNILYTMLERPSYAAIYSSMIPSNLSFADATASANNATVVSTIDNVQLFAPSYQGFPSAAQQVGYDQETGAVSLNYRTLGMAYIDNKILVNHCDWYNASGVPPVDNCYVIENVNANDLSGAVVNQTFNVGGAYNFSGYLMKVAEPYQALIGGQYAGMGAVESIATNFAPAPHLRGLQLSDFVKSEDPAVPVSIPQVSPLMHYPLSSEVGPNNTRFFDRSVLDKKTNWTESELIGFIEKNFFITDDNDNELFNTWWNLSSRVLAAWIIPDTRSLVVITATKGFNRRAGYPGATNAADVELSAKEQGGMPYRPVNPSRYNPATNTYDVYGAGTGYESVIADDNRHVALLFDLNHLIEVKNNLRAAHLVQPYFVRYFDNPLSDLDALGRANYGIKNIEARRGAYHTREDKFILSFPEGDPTTAKTVFNVMDYTVVTDGQLSNPFPHPVTGVSTVTVAENAAVMLDPVAVTGGAQYNIAVRFSADMISGQAIGSLSVLFDTGDRISIETTSQSVAAKSISNTFTAPAQALTAQISLSLNNQVNFTGDVRLAEVVLNEVTV